jgi:hydrogenase expression/formation protein HypC
MCIGIPMQVISTEGRHALCAGRGERRRVGTALLGEVAAGDWLLVFLDDARERIDAARAAEVNAALDLLLGAMQGERQPLGEVDFALPSQMSPEQMRALTGQETRT